MKKWKKRFLQIAGSFLLVFAIAIYTFFKTDLFADYRDLWVQTAMSTSNHKYLATWFLSDKEIDAILDKYEVINEENSSGEGIIIEHTAQEITMQEITGSTYHGYIVTIADPTSVSLVDTQDGYSGTKLSETVQDLDALVAINAGGFSRKNTDGVLNSFTMIDQELLYGEEDETYSMIGFTQEGILKLGNYTYEEALAESIADAISFGPFLIVDGKTQITETSTGGLQPRTAVGQCKDGTILFVVVEGRTSSSTGASLYDLQEIMKEYGAYNAANLDGGGSSALYYRGNLVNTLSNGRERNIPNALIVT
ncbi:phosphodiester glycosidase family protein [Breznakia sp. OttesenSCG-928-G09]|nr:phosphodiester glycosidase family protein [Breznakia sp. OttesenSCG-928-G09]